MIFLSTIRSWFSPQPDDPATLRDVKEKAGELAESLYNNCRQSPELQQAITRLRESVFWAEQAPPKEQLPTRMQEATDGQAHSDARRDC